MRMFWYIPWAFIDCIQSGISLYYEHYNCVTDLLVLCVRLAYAGAPAVLLNQCVTCSLNDVVYFDQANWQEYP